MTLTERHARITDLFTRASSLPAERREEFLRSACGADAELMEEVRRLLKADSGPTLDGAPAVRAAAAALVEDAGRAGSRIGPYKLLEAIGEGGFGVVYLAEQDSPVIRRVALKLIKPGMDSKAVIARFEAERQALAMMDHPNIARVLDAGATETGRPYFVMELVRGDPITEYCDKNNLTTGERLALFTNVCHAVQHAHQKGIIHRDVKPSNVLVTMFDGRPIPKVIDFGIAKAMNQRLTDKTLFTAHRQLIGTPQYMSPEQAEMSGVDIDTRSDIYSLGVLLYELLTGTTPFDPEHLRSAALAEVARIIREEEPPKPSTRLSSLQTLGQVAAHRRTEPGRLSALVRGDLDWIVMKCLEKDRTRRYGTADGLAADLQRHARGEPVTAAPPSRIYKLEKFVRRNRGAVTAGLLVALSLALGAAGFAWQAYRLTVQRDGAIAAREAEKKANAKAVAISSLIYRAFEQSDPTNGGTQGLLVADAMMNTAEWLGELRDQPDVEANVRVSIADILSRNGRPAEAADMAEVALAIYQRIGGDPSEFRSTYQALAVSQSALGDLDGAIENYRNALEWARKSGVEGEIAIALHNYADILSANGRTAEALPIFEDALQLLKKNEPGESIGRAIIMSSIARCLELEGRLEEAADLHEQAIAMHRRVQQGDSPELTNGITQYGYCLLRLDRANEALAQFQTVLDIRRRLFAGDHPEVAAALTNVGLALQFLGRPEEGVLALQESYEILQRLPSNEIALSDQMGGIGKALVDIGTLEAAGRAEPLLRHALENRQSFRTKTFLGAALTIIAEFDEGLDITERLARLSEGETLLVGGYQSLIENPNLPTLFRTPSYDLLGKARLWTVRLYEVWDRLAPGQGYAEKAASWRAKPDPPRIR